MSKFYVVGTPIGNMEDITLRAVRILNEVDVIVSEDTRVTKNLLDRLNIKKPLQSYPSDDLKNDKKVQKVFALVRESKDIAFVTCAGTPGISDPGSKLVGLLRDEFPDLQIFPIPGPSALVTAISVSGLEINDFTFLGFLPHKKGRETLFKEIASAERAMVFYESPHRILKALVSLEKFAPKKKVVVARELTKTYEQIISGTPSEVLAYFFVNPDKIRGEFVVIVS